MNAYLCARYSRHPEMRDVVRQLATIGVEVTSRWILGDHEVADASRHDAEARRFAEEDRDDLVAADFMIAFTEGANPPGRNRGGRHVEAGYALDMGKRVYIVGPRENAFRHLPEVRQYDDWAAFWEGFTGAAFVPPATERAAGLGGEGE